MAPGPFRYDIQSVPNPPDSFEAATYRKVSRRLIPLLFVAYIAAYLDRVNVGFAKLGMAADLGFSDTVYGLGAGIFFLGYFLFEVPSNVILQRVGARRWIARIMITWGLLSAATMFVTTATTFYLMRFLLGVAEAGFFPGVILYLTYWFPRAERGRRTAAFMTAVAVAGVIGGPVSGWIMGNLGGVGGWAGWQWLFLLEGIPSVVIGLVVLAFLDDGPAGARWLTEPERALLVARLADDEQAKRSETAPRQTIGGAFTDPRIWLFCVVYFGLALGIYGISFWLPQIIKETITTDNVRIGLISAIPWIAATVAMVWNGRRSDRTGERHWHTAGPALIGGIALGVSALPGVGGWAGIAAITVATAGILSAASSFWSLPTAILSGAGAAAGIAWINSVGNLAGYASPYLVGKIRDLTHSMVAAMVLLASGLVISGLLVLATRTAARNSPRP
ncbi:MAG: MFS transporter [Gemmatimonadales bacterium]